jgi:DNA-binding transcriptional MerR regulator
LCVEEREADVARVRFVKSAQRLGFSLDEVEGLLTLDDGTHCDEARQVAEQKLADVRGNWPIYGASNRSWLPWFAIAARATARCHVL